MDGLFDALIPNKVLNKNSNTLHIIYKYYGSPNDIC
jgi:hypothetical protein